MPILSDTIGRMYVVPSPSKGGRTTTRPAKGLRDRNLPVLVAHWQSTNSKILAVSTSTGIHSTIVILPDYAQTNTGAYVDPILSLIHISEPTRPY